MSRAIRPRRVAPQRFPQRDPLASPTQPYTDLAYYEKQLARRALQHASQIRDPDLNATVRQVATRRRLREQAARQVVRTTTTGRSASVLETIASGPSITLLRVQKPVGFAFSAGQHVKLGADETSVMRAYSIASAPHEAHLEFCVERIPQGKLSPRLSELETGARIFFRGKARGRFVLDPKCDLHVMVATKTGIAPFRSMVVELLNEHAGSTARILVLHGASHVSDLPYRAEFEQLMQEHARRLIYVPTISRPDDPANQGWSGHVGRVELLAGEILPSYLSDAKSPKVYLCGNAGMISSVRSEWTARGVDCASEAFD